MPNFRDLTADEDTVLRLIQSGSVKLKNAGNLPDNALVTLSAAEAFAIYRLLTDGAGCQF